MSETSRPAMELRGLTKIYGDTVALKDVSFQIAPGQVLGLLGPNGAGKSTLIKSLIGLVVPSRGQVNVLDLDVKEQPLAVRQRVGYVPEQHFMYAFMRVSEVIAFVKPFYARWSDARAAELVRQFGLDPTKRVKHLSKGMITKLALVLALAHDPDVLILDEPMAGLDALVREELVEGVLDELCHGRRTMLLSSHTFSDVHRLADVIGIMNEGQLLTLQPTTELIASTKRLRVVLPDGESPRELPEGTICERRSGREWLVSVSRLYPEKLERFKRANAFEQFEVLDLGLEEIFKDYIRGARAARPEVIV